MATKKVEIDILARDKTRKALRGVQAGINNVKKSVFNLRNALLALGAGATIKTFVDVGRQVENLQLRFKFLFGSVEEGAKAFDSLVNFAAKVPFSLEEIQGASGNLAVISKDADELAQNLKIVGNVASITGLDFQTTAEQIQRSFAGGIASADIFREKGVRALLGFQAGATVSVEETRKAFFKVFGEGGEFGKATDELSKTFDGTLSMIGDSIFKFKKDVADAGLFQFVKFTAETVDLAIKRNFGSIEKFAEDTSEALIKAFKGIALGFAGTADLLKGPIRIIFNGVQTLIGAMMQIPEPFRSLGVLGFLALGFKGKAAVVLVAGFFEEIKILAKSVADFVGAKIEGIDSNFKDAFDKVVTDARNESIEAANKFSKFIKEDLKFGESLQLDLDLGLTQSVKEFFEEFEKLFEKTKSLKGAFEVGLGGGADVIVKTKEEVKGLSDAFELGLGGALDGVQIAFERTTGVVAGFKTGFSEAMNDAMDLTDEFQRIGTKAFRGLQDVLTEFVMTGKLTFQDLARTITRMLVEALIGQAIQAAIKKSVALFKASAIREALIDVYTAAVKAFKNFGGFPFGFAAATATIAAGMGLVNKIKGFEKGGIARANQPAIVGEAGPELIMPRKDMQVTPNNKLGTMGGSVNVNFTINAVDTRGFRSLLTNERGTIVNIINQAVTDKARPVLV